ncbi:histidine kinase [Pseudomonas sp. Marseille-P8916]|uniref:histidine kinase n=1 Tax=Pseudomonas sp. Marseille-P8916 TaxID=2866589 RepID=UPI001CE4A77D|nr:histidine kinase [Pseudomonas sp. Marseille-P8916]
MHRLNVLIHQARPSHRILLHQACNALGIFNVRLTQGLPDTQASLAQGDATDLLILDHAMPEASGLALLRHVLQTRRPRALLFVGQPSPGKADLAQQARQQGLWVIAELRWPLSMAALHDAVRRLRPIPGACGARDTQTVICLAHAH